MAGKRGLHDLEGRARRVAHRGLALPAAEDGRAAIVESKGAVLPGITIEAVRDNFDKISDMTGAPIIHVDGSILTSRMIGDPRYAEKHLGFRAKIPLRDGLRQLYEEMR